MENKTHKQLIAGAIAAVLTLGTAGAAVALNLGTAADEDPSPAGQLTATSPPTTAPTPSTIYVDVPVTEPASASSGSQGQDAQYKDAEYEDDEHRDDEHEDDDHEEYEGREDDD
jgi:hypothetical protein